MIEVRVPDEQEATKAVVRAWLKQVGDTVAENDPLVELETDKVTQEVPAPAAGVLAEIVLDTDAEAVPGALLGRISAGQVRPKSFVPKEEARPAAREPTGFKPIGAGETRLSPSVRRACLQHGIDPAGCLDVAVQMRNREPAFVHQTVEREFVPQRERLRVGAVTAEHELDRLAVALEIEEPGRPPPQLARDLDDPPAGEALDDLRRLARGRDGRAVHFGSRGSPSARSPSRFCMIWLLPPEIV